VVVRIVFEGGIGGRVRKKLYEQVSPSIISSNQTTSLITRCSLLQCKYSHLHKIDLPHKIELVVNHRSQAVFFGEEGHIKIRRNFLGNFHQNTQWTPTTPSANDKSAWRAVPKFQQPQTQQTRQRCRKAFRMGWKFDMSISGKRGWEGSYRKD